MARRAIVFNNLAQITNLAQILQSPKSEIVTCVMHSTHTNTSLIKPHLTELDEIHRNRPKSNYNLAKNLQSWSVTSDRHTQTEIHTFFIWYPRVGREHNSPSGKKNRVLCTEILILVISNSNKFQGVGFFFPYNDSSIFKSVI